MNKSFISTALGGLMLAAAAMQAPVALAEENSTEKAYAGVNLGIANVINGKGSAVGGFELRGAPMLWKLYPQGGGFVTHRGAVYGYAGVGIDLRITDWALIRGNTAVGAYGEGEDRDLGHVVEFRSGVELVFVLPNEGQIGVGFHHLSNAGLGDRNPGTEIATVSYSMPLDKLF